MGKKTPSETCANRLLIDSPLGIISLESDAHESLLKIDIGDQFEHLATRGHCPVLIEVSEQILAYLNGDRRRFDLDNWTIAPARTDWQQRVRNVIAKVPWGHTISYGELAQKAGGESRQHARAAGQACGSNLFPILIPCHRILASQGQLGGFTGGLGMKRHLLHLEGSLPAGSA
ncbi:MAG: methylated-DNA--[protein]-cysteine S-methyltransferase [Gammaproteobacteria bacterium]